MGLIYALGSWSYYTGKTDHLLLPLDPTNKNEDDSEKCRWALNSLGGCIGKVLSRVTFDIWSYETGKSARLYPISSENQASLTGCPTTLE